MRSVEKRRLLAAAMTTGLGLSAALTSRAEQPANGAEPAPTGTVAAAASGSAAAPASTGTAAAAASGSAAAPAPTGTVTAAASGSAAARAAPPAAGKGTEPGKATPARLPRAHFTYLERSPPSAFNPQMPRVKWDESWPKFGIGELVTTGLAGAGVFAVRAIPPQPSNWRTVNDFDATARSALRLPTLSARNTADDASDLILSLMVNQLLVDATLVAWWGHDRFTVGSQMVLIDLEALAVTGSLQALVSALVSRWRPFRDTCVGPKESQTRDCQENKQYTSFWSGHTSGAFTVAGLMCMHHAHIPLYGGGTPEALTCAASFAAAATVGYLRMAADQHFLTDVLVGAAIGTLSGLGIPWLLHYRGGAQSGTTGRSKRANQMSLRILPTPLGFVASGEL